MRSYEDLLGLMTGGTDGLGHLGFAAAPGLAPFGKDVFNQNQGWFNNQLRIKVTRWWSRVSNSWPGTAVVRPPPRPGFPHAFPRCTP
jgi:hypothetical protein